MSLRLAVPVAATLTLTALTCIPAVAQRAADNTLEIRFVDHHFTPQSVTVPAGRPLVLKVVNASTERIEFESFALNREVVLTPGETTHLHLPALKPGSYDFYDDFHQDVPEGSITARQRVRLPEDRTRKDLP